MHFAGLIIELRANQPALDPAAVAAHDFGSSGLELLKFYLAARIYV
jgi:hypothetical protein